MTTPDEAQALLPVTPDRNSPERKRARLLRRFDEFAEAAAAATPGGWHRTHGVIASVVTHIHEDRKKVDVDRHVVATADVARVNLLGHEPDIARESANARWITLASPRNILSLIAAFREQLDQSHSLPGDVGMQSAVERFLADYDDGDRADAGVHPLMEAHVADFRAALTPSALSAEPVQKVHELPEGHRWCRHCEQKDPHCSVCEGVGYLPNTVARKDTP